MNIINFTPISALLGGFLIGLSVALFFILNGRMVGISGIASNLLVSKNNRFENFLFLAGLIISPLVYKLIFDKEISVSISNSLILLILAGVMVGFGTRIGNGCTSGHGISGISRFSIRSIIATITFMIFGIATVFVKGVL
tara:strand:- start:36 stop:455 length:420 start_codon:yes stop_codon:yes gene_type:complete